MTKVAFSGTGTMGMPMACNLARAGFEVRAWRGGHGDEDMAAMYWVSAPSFAKAEHG